MNVLVIGGSGNVTNAVLEKLNKEGHRIYVLTGSEVKSFSYKHVFEQYSFTYESNSIREIFESIQPDVTIFMGAYDTNFHWKNAREESVRYTAGLLNILTGYSLVKCGRFIYLSSDLVYQQSYPDDIPEEEPASADDFRGMAISQGESLCKNYQQFEGLDIVILRMDHLYGIPNEPEEADNICGSLCIQALKTGKIEADSRNSFSMLYLSDAVDFLYQIIRAEKHAQSIYHLSSSVEVNEVDLALLIQKGIGMDISVEGHPGQELHRVVLSGEKFREEFSEKILHPVEEMVPQVAAQIRKNKEKFLEGEEQTGGSRKQRFLRSLRATAKTLIPFAENLICFIPFFMLNNRAVGSVYFNKLDFYLLYVLLFAIVHGQQQATLSAILATAGYCFRQMYHRTGFEVLLDYNTYVWIAQLFILGLVVGHLKDELTNLRKESKSEARYLNGQIEDIHDINTSNVRIKNVLEEQVINHEQSVGKIYEITSELDKYAPEEVLFYAAETIERLLKTKDVAIYVVTNQDYARLFTATSAKARSMGNTIRYREMEEFYEMVEEKKVFINKSLKKEYPMFATGTFENDRLQLIVMVWGIPWERMNIGEANLLTVVSFLIRNAMLRANRYQKALETEKYCPGTHILEKDTFRSLVRAYLTAQKKQLTECALLAVEVTYDQMGAVSEKLEKVLRSTDYIGEAEPGRLYVLLPNTDWSGVQKVLRRIEEIKSGAVVVGRVYRTRSAD
jgi:nucleoside-diphosphate-sugar epimerase